MSTEKNGNYTTHTLIQYIIKTEVALPFQVVLQIKAKASEHLFHSCS